MVNDVTTIPLDLAYKGARNYLHGTDIYQAIMNHLTCAVPEYCNGPFKMVIHEFVRSQCRMLYTVGPDRVARPPMARVEFTLANKVTGWLAETGQPVYDRRPYPEDAIVADSRVVGQVIYAGKCTSFGPIEVLVAVTKRLHMAVRPERSRWAFTRLELLRPLRESDCDDLEIELLQSLGNRLTKASVRAGGSLLGHVYFSTVEA